jgi:hypothetical protein
VDALDDLLVGHVAHRAAGAAHDVERVGPVGRVADGQRLGDGRGLTGCTVSQPFSNAVAIGEQPVACAP